MLDHQSSTDMLSNKDNLDAAHKKLNFNDIDSSYQQRNVLSIEEQFEGMPIKQDHATPKQLVPPPVNQVVDKLRSTMSRRNELYEYDFENRAFVIQA